MLTSETNLSAHLLGFNDKPDQLAGFIYLLVMFQGLT